MNDIIVILLLILPGYISVLVFQFFTGIKLKNTLTQNIISISISFIGLLELKFIPPISNYLNKHLIKASNPISNIFSGKIILIIFFLIFLSLVTIIIIQLLIKFGNFILIKFFKRSIDQNLLFHYSKLYTKKSKQNDPLHVLIKLNSGTYLYGVPMKFSDLDEHKQIYLISVIELDNNFNIINTFTDFKNRTEDGILIDFNNCDFIAYNVKDDIIKTNINNKVKSEESIANIVTTILNDKKIISSFNLSRIKENDEEITLKLERKD